MLTFQKKNFLAWFKDLLATERRLPSDHYFVKTARELLQLQRSAMSVKLTSSEVELLEEFLAVCATDLTTSQYVRQVNDRIIAQSRLKS